MDNVPRTFKDNFLYAISSYHGSLSQDKVIFNTKLQEFAQKVGFIANLYTSGKITPREAYSQLESLWRELEMTKKTIFDDQ
ncbi:MAG: hypothetical protein QNJ64_10410 [Crocosphaera sp.]|nr:hypothetical protein [Crocosphaera sp.]